ncbi:MAG TPA: KH domain-containing protein [Acidimicrobiales bacterium]|nr:KH domain-containing protein [Acidimicrobiales bacterium]
MSDEYADTYADEDDPNRRDDDDLDEGDDEADANTIVAASARSVLEYLAKSVVDDPNGVRVEVTDGRPVTLEVHVSEGDMGRVIGKRGRVANAIRTVVRAAAARDGVEVDVEFVD